MSANTLFLQPSSSSSQPFLNVANGSGGLSLLKRTEESTAVLTNAEVQTLVNGGVVAAVAEAAATYLADPDFSNVFNSSTVIGADGTYQGIASSRAEVVATYAVQRGDRLSFDFQADIALQAAEIEHKDRYYSLVDQKTSFLVIDLDPPRSSWQKWQRWGQPQSPKIIGHFGMGGRLESSQKSLQRDFSKSSNVSLIWDKQSSDIDRNNGSDFLTRSVSGRFNETFDDSSRIAVVKITTSFTKVLGDELIDGLGRQVNYGTIFSDTLYAPYWGGQVYASLGDDTVKGSRGKDILEGGGGDDKLYGYDGNDRLHGSSGADWLDGGAGDDLLVGGDHNDRLDGHYGNDVMVGVNPLSSNAGAGEIDSLTGGGYPTRGIVDTFVLGDNKQVYYRSAGAKDYALITDFAQGIDQIWLHGHARDYDVDYVRSGWSWKGSWSWGTSDGLPSGSRIYYTAGGGKELIGVVQDVNLERSLGSSSVFRYNQSPLA